MAHQTKTTTTETLIVPLFVSALLFGGLAWWMTADNSGPSKATAPVVTKMEWPPLNISLATLEKARERAPTVREDRRGAEEVEALLATVRTANDHQFETAPIPTIPEMQLRDRVTYAVSDAIVLVEPDKFVSLGQPLFRECEKGLKKLQDAVAAGEVSLEQARTDPNFERFPKYRRNCGAMLGRMVDFGLMDDRAQWVDEEAEAIGSILQRLRWANLAIQYHKPLQNLTEEERCVFLAWAVSTPDAYSMDKRRDYLDALTHLDPTYPTEVAEVMLAHESGGPRKAAEYLSRYLNKNPGDPNLRAMKQSLDHELGTIGPKDD